MCIDLTLLDAQSAADSIQSNVNSVQNNANAQASRLNSGPLVDSIKAEADKTSAEFSNLANSKTRPSKPAATGQPLTGRIVIVHSQVDQLLIAFIRIPLDAIYPTQRMLHPLTILLVTQTELV